MKDRTQAFLWGWWTGWAARAAVSIAGNMNALSRVGFLQLYLCPEFPRTGWQSYFETTVTEQPKLQTGISLASGRPSSPRCGGMEVLTLGPTPRLWITVATWLLWMLTKGVGEITFQWPGTLTSHWPSPRDVFTELSIHRAMVGSAWFTTVEIPSLWASFWYACAHLPATRFTGGFTSSDET